MTVQPDPQAFLAFNRDDARKLLDRLDHIHLVAILPDAPKGTLPRGKYFGSDVDAALDWAANVNGNGWGVYWTLNYVGPGVGTKPKKSNIQAARGAHCDLDPPKDGSAWDKASAAAELTATTCPPSLILDTGNGVQPVWLLDQPARDWQPIEGVNAALRDRLGADDCHNIDRLMRLPGSVNYPTKTKRERDCVPCIAGWIQEDTGQRYTVSDLVEAFPPAKSNGKCDAPEEPQERQRSKTGDLIARIRRGDGWHNAMLSLTAHLVGVGTADSVMLAMADCLTLDGYTVEETRETMRGMIADARRKWHCPEPSDPVQGYTDAETGEWTPYGPGDGEPDAPALPELLPTLDLAELATRRAEPMRYAVERIAPEGEVTLLYGAGSAGKSLLGQQLATCMAAGRPCLGLTVTPGAAIYLTCEDDAAQLHWRQQHLCEALGIPMASLAGRLHLVSLRGELGNELATFGHDGRASPTPAYHRLVATLLATGARLLILDNVAHLFIGNENDRADVTRFVNLLNRLAGETGAAIILIGHPNKAGDEYSGSTGWNNAVRSRLWLEHDEASDTRRLILPKANYSKTGDVVSFRWHNWAFVRDEDLPDDTAAQLREISLANAANSAFLACLRQRASEGVERAVGPHTGPNYAPSQFEGMPQAKGLKRAALKQAMDRLYQAGLIETKQVERPGKAMKKTIIVEAFPNAPNASPNASLTRFPNGPERQPERPRTHSVYTSYIRGAAHEAAAPLEDEGCQP